MKKRILSIIMIIIGVALIVVGVLLNSNDNNNNNNEKTEQKVSSNKEILEESIKNIFLNKNCSIEDAKKILGENYESLAVGEGSFLRKKTDDTSLKEYEKLQNKLVIEVEDTYLKYTTYSISDEENPTVQVKAWNYSQYKADVYTLTSYLFDLVNYKIDFDSDAFDKEEYTINFYKAKVIAINILSTHLEDYKNEVTNKMIFEFKNGKAQDNQYFSLLQLFINNNVQERKQILKNYFDEALKKGTIKENDPLGL